MDDLERLLKQKQEIEERIEAVRLAEKEATVAEIRRKVQLFGITAIDLGLTEKVGRVLGKVGSRTVAPRYRDPSSGTTWSGRGKPPRWIAGKDRSQFAL